LSRLYSFQILEVPQIFDFLWHSVSDLTFIPSLKGVLTHRNGLSRSESSVKIDGEWRIKLFQNTPAQFHGRPELVEQMTDELRKEFH